MLCRSTRENVRREPSTLSALLLVILVDTSHTSHTQARTGVQRVCRRLLQSLPAEPGGFPITWDPFEQSWRPLAEDERKQLDQEEPGRRRSASWTWRQRVRGWLRRGSARVVTEMPSASGLIVPEIFSTQVAAAFPFLATTVRGPRVALFHDAIALKLPELTPTKTVARFPGYLRDLLDFDGVAAVSEDSRVALHEWWQWLEVKPTPPLVCIPLGIDAPRKDPSLARATALPVVLCVGTFEGRKNHDALLEACESLWSRGLDFELRLIGMAPSPGQNPVLARVRHLQTTGRRLRYDGPVDDATLSAAYHECSFTVYPSLMEGFGLPVLESLSYGKPCVCSARGALGESAGAGGCLTLESVDSTSLARGLESLLQRPAHREALAAQARGRRLRTWGDHATDLLAWMRGLPVRSKR